MIVLIAGNRPQLGARLLKRAFVRLNKTLQIVDQLQAQAPMPHINNV